MRRLLPEDIAVRGSFFSFGQFLWMDGNIPFTKDRLHSLAIVGERISALSFITFMGMSSGPGFVVLHPYMMVDTSWVLV